MMAAITILGETHEVACQPCAERRLADLAAALERRLVCVAGDEAPTRRLTLAALALLDEAQAANAALARARVEIERLNDLLLEARHTGADA